MVEIESCGNLVNASSALLIRGIEEEVKGECSVNEVLAQVSADLQSERQKNAELAHRISMLEEAQLQNVETYIYIFVFLPISLFILDIYLLALHLHLYCYSFLFEGFYPQIN